MPYGLTKSFASELENGMRAQLRKNATGSGANVQLKAESILASQVGEGNTIAVAIQNALSGRSPKGTSFSIADVQDTFSDNEAAEYVTKLLQNNGYLVGTQPSMKSTQTANVQSKAEALLAAKVHSGDQFAQLIQSGLEGTLPKDQRFYAATIYNTLNMQQDVSDYVATLLARKGYQVTKQNSSSTTNNGVVNFSQENIQGTVPGNSDGVGDGLSGGSRNMG